MGWFSRSRPRDEHDSCSKRIGALEESVQKLQLDSVERNLQVLELAEKVAFRLRDRKKKRDEAEQEEQPPPNYFRSRRGF